MQFQVPQFIETEDKIVGPLSLKQFLYIGAAGVLSFVLYYVVAFWLWVIFSSIIGGAAVAIAFIKVSGKPMLSVIGSAFSFYWNPQTYVWKPESPHIRKEEEIQSSGALDKVIAGVVLKDTWRTLQTGVPAPPREKKERYEIFQRLSGERQVAKRVDYR